MKIYELNGTAAPFTLKRKVGAVGLTETCISMNNAAFRGHQRSLPVAVTTRAAFVVCVSAAEPRRRAPTLRQYVRRCLHNRHSSFSTTSRAPSLHWGFLYSLMISTRTLKTARQAWHWILLDNPSFGTGHRVEIIKALPGFGSKINPGNAYIMFKLR